jgi:ParB/RepB/Spo0J family partition protein
MELEFHRLDRRYEALRRTSPERESRLLASLAAIEQQAPIVVVPGGDSGRHIIVDGYKRVRALIHLRRDTVRAVLWDLSELEAVLLERALRAGDTDGPLEQGWLLRELRDRFGLTLDELARRFGKSASWASRRLALVAELPDAIQDQVRRGEIPPHAAMKLLVPLARANIDDCLRFAKATAPLRPTTRQLNALCTAFQSGSAKSRELILSDPELFLRARAQVTAPAEKERDPAAVLLGDLGALGGIARRVHRRFRDGIVQQLAPPELDELRRCGRQSRADIEQLFTRFDQEVP